VSPVRDTVAAGRSSPRRTPPRRSRTRFHRCRIPIAVPLSLAETREAKAGPLESQAGP